jgi:hypothetical protein
MEEEDECPLWRPTPEEQESTRKRRKRTGQRQGQREEEELKRSSSSFPVPAMALEAAMAALELETEESSSDEAAFCREPSLGPLKMEDNFDEANCEAEPEMQTPSGSESEDFAEEMLTELERQEASEAFHQWLRSHYPAGCSAVKTGFLLAEAFARDPSRLGQLTRSLLTRPDGGSSPFIDGRQRDVLPLPLPSGYDEELACLGVLNWRRKEEGDSVGSSAIKHELNKQRHGRTSGASPGVRKEKAVKCWVLCMVVSLNWLWSGGRPQGFERCLHRPNAAQCEALKHLEACAAYWLDQGVGPDGPPSVPSDDWEARLKDTRINYEGESVLTAVEMTLNQLLPGLPSAEHAGVVDILELCSESLGLQLKNPESLLRDQTLDSAAPYTAKVHATSQEWELIGSELFRRGICEPLEEQDIYEHKGRKVLCGSFGVVKANEFLPSGEAILRLIFNMIPLNALMESLSGDVETLTGSTGWLSVLMQSDEFGLISGEDLTAAFYLFKLPRCWRRFMGINKKIKWKALGQDRPGSTFLSIAVVPMGWSSAVGIIQHVHRRLMTHALYGPAVFNLNEEVNRQKELPPKSRLWSLYIDDSTILDILKKGFDELKCKDKELAGTPSKVQLKARERYQEWDIPFSKKKSIEQAFEAKRLGALFDGRAGRLGCATQRGLDVLGLGWHLMARKRIAKKMLQAFLGKDCHIMQWRRPLMSTYDEVWKAVVPDKHQISLTRGCCSEMLVALGCRPLMFSSWRAKLSPVTTCSDASETGGGICSSQGLTVEGEIAALRLLGVDWLADQVQERPVATSMQPFMTIDWFAGMGGLEQSLRLLGLHPQLQVFCENSGPALRVLRSHWPGGIFWNDILRVTQEDIEKAMDRAGDVKGIIQAGGSPCQGLSQLSSERKHFADERSNLFFKFVELLESTERAAKKRSWWFLTLAENVVADSNDYMQMCDRLGTWAIRFCPSGLSRVRRPRNFWCRDSAGNEWTAPPDGSLLLYDDYVELIITVPIMDDSKWLTPGWEWPSGKERPLLRLPTFTRSIPRKKPPPRPAGLSRCPEETVEKWRSHNMRYPPYTYLPEYLVTSQKQSRVVNSEEREALSFFPKGYTLAVKSKKLSSWAAVEDERCCLVGNGFHAGAVAVLVSWRLHQLEVGHVYVEASQIVKNFEAQLATFRPMGPSPWLPDEEGDVFNKDKEEEEELDITQACIDLEELALERVPRGVLDGDFKLTRAHLPKVLTEAFLRRVQYRGSDIRMDVGVMLNPEAVPRMPISARKWRWRAVKGWAWKDTEHINVLEARAILQTLKWRSRSLVSFHSRFVHLSDSQVSLAIYAKGRSSSFKLNRVLRKAAALLLATDMYPLMGFIRSADNPADKPSRMFKHAKKSHFEKGH